MTPCILASSAVGDWLARRLANQKIQGILFSDISLIPPAQWLHLPLLAAMGPRPESQLVWFVECTHQQPPCFPTNLQRGDILVLINQPGFQLPHLQVDGIELVDLALYGNEFGIEHGFVQLVGAQHSTLTRLSPLLDALAPHHSSGWLHVGLPGAAGLIRAITISWENSIAQPMPEGNPLLGQSQFPAPQEWARWLGNLSGNLHRDLAEMARIFLESQDNKPFTPFNLDLQERITSWFKPFLSSVSSSRPIACILAEALITLHELGSSTTTHP